MFNTKFISLDIVGSWLPVFRRSVNIVNCFHCHLFSHIFILQSMSIIAFYLSASYSIRHLFIYELISSRYTIKKRKMLLYTIFSEYIQRFCKFMLCESFTILLIIRILHNCHMGNDIYVNHFENSSVCAPFLCV